MKTSLTDHEKRQLEASLEQMKPLLTLYLLTPYQTAKALEKKLMFRVTPTMILRRVGPEGKLFQHEWPKSAHVLMTAMAKMLVSLTTPVAAGKPSIIPLDPAIAEYLADTEYPAVDEPEETDETVMSNRFDPVALDKKAIHV